MTHKRTKCLRGCQVRKIIVKKMRENIYKLNDFKIKILKNYVIGPNNKLIILLTSDIQIKLKIYVVL